MTRAYEDSRAQGPIANRLQSNKSPGALQDFGRISNREVKRMNLISRVMVVFGVLALILAPASKQPLIRPKFGRYFKTKPRLGIAATSMDSWPDIGSLTRLRLWAQAA
jgi:hypothetical protein